MSIKLMTMAWDTELNGNDKLVLLKLCDNANDEGTECFPSVQNISDKTGASKSTVKYILKALEIAGFIKKVRRERENGSTSSNGFEILRFDISLDAYKKAYHEARNYEPKSHNVTPQKPQCDPLENGEKGHNVTPQKPHCDPLYEPSVFNHPKKSIKKSEGSMHNDLAFRKLISTLYNKVPYKSKVRNNLETYNAYLELGESDIDMLINDYANHQEEEKKYSLNLENFLKDYRAITAEREEQQFQPILGLG